MAIAPTGTIYKALEFDNVSSRTYGVYITGEAVYNAPARDVDMITIPGRNGSFALDNGRFQNIEISYPAGIFADTEADFRQAISDFRNFLCSRKGYVRLTDEYNPNEYRMAVYKSGLEVDPAMLKAGEFKITFDCKPQRWLTSGESAVTIANSGDTITNPTLFDASPLLEVEGYGTTAFNGQDIVINHETMGHVDLFAFRQFTHAVQGSGTITVSDLFGKMSVGDTITIISDPSSPTWNIIRAEADFKLPTGYQFYTKDTYTLSTSGDTGKVRTASIVIGTNSSNKRISLANYLSLKDLQFIAGTASNYSVQMTVSGNLIDESNNTDKAFSVQCSLTVAYDGNTTFTYTNTATIVSDASSALYVSYYNTMTGTGEGESSKLAFGQPTYIDCDLGEAYTINSGEVISLNQYIDLGSKLPTLSSGSNAITYDNTITRLKVTPRWWKV